MLGLWDTHSKQNLLIKSSLSIILMYKPNPPGIIWYCVFKQLYLCYIVYVAFIDGYFICSSDVCSYWLSMYSCPMLISCELINNFCLKYLTEHLSLFILAGEMWQLANNIKWPLHPGIVHNFCMCLNLIELDFDFLSQVDLWITFIKTASFLFASDTWFINIYLYRKLLITTAHNKSRLPVAYLWHSNERRMYCCIGPLFVCFNSPHITPYIRPISIIIISSYCLYFFIDKKTSCFQFVPTTPPRPINFIPRVWKVFAWVLNPLSEIKTNNKAPLDTSLKQLQANIVTSYQFTSVLLIILSLWYQWNTSSYYSLSKLKRVCSDLSFIL